METTPRLGTYLRHRREARGLTLENLSESTRVRSRYLLALEEDRLDALPAPVYVRGYIRAYCASVGETPGDPLHLYEVALRRIAPPPTPAPPPRSATRRRGALPALIVTALLLLGGALYLFASPLTPAPSPGPADRGATASR